MSLYLEEFKASENYKIRFIHPLLGVVEGWLKGPPSISTSSQWTDLANQKGGGGKLDSAAQYFTGRSMTMGEFTIQKWQGQSPVMVSFHLAYVAIHDAFNEVVVPVRELLKFPLTPEFTPFLLKTPVDPTGGETACCYALGKWFAIPGLLPVSVQPDYNHTLDKTGHPISATVEISFQYFRACSMQDIQKWFK